MTFRYLFFFCLFVGWFFSVFNEIYVCVLYHFCLVSSTNNYVCLVMFFGCSTYIYLCLFVCVFVFVCIYPFWLFKYINVFLSQFVCLSLYACNAFVC